MQRRNFFTKARKIIGDFVTGAFSVAKDDGLAACASHGGDHAVFIHVVNA